MKSRWGLRPPPRFPRKFPAACPYLGMLRGLLALLGGGGGRVSYRDKYGKNSSPGPVLLGSAAACSRQGSRCPLSMGFLPPAPPQPKSFSIQSPRRAEVRSLPSPHHRCPCPGCQLPSGPGGLNPGANLCVLSKQVEKCKQHQEAPSGSSGLYLPFSPPSVQQ